MQKKSLVHVYTGDGKGKTTAACGLAVRALSHGLKVGWISFHKDPQQHASELKILKTLGAVVLFFAKEHHACKGSSKCKSKKQLTLECKEGLQKTLELFHEAQLDMIILDEINICVRDEFIKEDDLIRLITAKPQNMELILTGRAATEKIRKLADLVSVINEEKHPWGKGIQARKGIEY